MYDANPGWLAHCTEIIDVADLLPAPSTMRLDQAALLLVSDGQAMLSINGHEEQLLFGQLIALEKGSVIRLASANHFDFSGYLISFNTYDTEMQSPCDWNTDRAAGYRVQSVPEAVVAEIRSSLTRSTGPLGITMKQYILYHLLKELQQEQPTADSTLEQRLARTVIYMQQNYHQMITRDELAAIAGYSPSYYSRKFTQLYHKTPVEYLIRYRMYRAQEWLLLTDDSSRQVARKTGFEDAQYFSRQFRQVAGLPPMRFKSSVADSRICFLSAAHAEIAIALGVIPQSVVIVSALTPDYQQPLFHMHGVTLLAMPQYVTLPDLIAEQEPDLIVAEHLTEELKQYFRAIAPILTRLPDDLSALISYFGTLFNREAQAAQLIAGLTVQADLLRNKLQRQLPGGSTVLYLRVEELGYRYIGESSSDAATLLYKELGLTMPEIVRAHENSFNPCTLQQLAEANPTYLFIEKRIMDYYSADLSLSKLQTSEKWAALDAVKNNRVIYVDTGLWINNCSAYGKRAILQQMEQAMLESGAPETQ
ncbi:AraC family transcriptional regulator [Paenibacillus sp. FSL P4-0338]|uniref:helix-turn-helix domain-containing protein n=1 Tax=unclassified Paenibacillus TaxID=185978 RepID=UPI0003E24A48|nr:AraC family transcriptional regulator [Paenibacillus sp. FSL R7-269]ETT54556.1 AraC family transcriptional regulator [Paenibacillus sp. FSL R7-269]